MKLERKGSESAQLLASAGSPVLVGVAMPPPTVLHIIGYDDDAGGIVSVVRALAGASRFQCILGVNPGFVQRRDPPLPTLTLPRVEGEKISAANLWRTRRAARVCRRWLHEDPNRIVHGHSRAGLLVAWWLRRWSEPRCVASVHCYGTQRWFYRSMRRQFERRLFWLSPSMRDYYEAPGEGWNECVPGCLADTPRIEPKQLYAEPPLRIGGVGALVSWKGWHLVLEALALLSDDERRRVRFRHIGGPLETEESRSYAASLKARTAALGLGEIVTWLGPQSSAQTLLGSTDLLVVASENEPFSIAMLEALFHRIPVLAANTGGAKDIISSPLHGWLFESGDAEDLAAALKRLINTRDLAYALFDRESLRRFTAESVASQWLHIYSTVGASFG